MNENLENATLETEKEEKAELTYNTEKTNNFEFNDKSFEEEEYNEEEFIEKMPEFVFPTKLFLINTFFTVLGLFFLIFGLVKFFKHKNHRPLAMTFICMGTVMLVPGIYYNLIILYAKKAKSLADREDYLQELPDFKKENYEINKIKKLNKI